MSVPQVNIAEIAERNGLTVGQVQDVLDSAIKSMSTYMQRIDVVDNQRIYWYSVERKGVGRIKTPQGFFWEYLFLINDEWQKYNVIIKADLDDDLMPIFRNKDRLILRIDSGCATGQIFGDLTCDCSQQLFKAMQIINDIGEGLIINIPNQDGRGMTLGFKLATLTLQEELRLNTVESASILSPGGVIDVRTYPGVIAIMKFFDIPTTCAINLASNNPQKALIFSENGYHVTGMLPVVIPPTDDTRHHFASKQEHLGHIKLIDAQD